ncbi:WhiB family transcriptional regulator [Glutamicibacter arilaitensis]|uniref:WhiB family transcriptional regulator n=1 Tax=Glutamicibacter arilaitensis TaxID=256701 RepID=UPI003FD24971
MGSAMVSRRIPSMIQQAPDLSSDPNAWMDQAACADMAKTWDFRKNGDPFYPISSAPFAAKPGKKICEGCPVISICFEHGQSNPNSRQYGTFGGLSQEERRTRRKLKQRVEASQRRQERKQASK